VEAGAIATTGTGAARATELLCGVPWGWRLAGGRMTGGWAGEVDGCDGGGGAVAEAPGVAERAVLAVAAAAAMVAVVAVVVVVVMVATVVVADMAPVVLTTRSVPGGGMTGADSKAGDGPAGGGARASSMGRRAAVGTSVIATKPSGSIIAPPARSRAAG